MAAGLPDEAKAVVLQYTRDRLVIIVRTTVAHDNRKVEPDVSNGLVGRAFSKGCPLKAAIACMLLTGTQGRIPMIKVGAKAPDFALRSHQGEEVTLSQFRGDKWVVLHTFPLAFTGG